MKRALIFTLLATLLSYFGQAQERGNLISATPVAPFPYTVQNARDAISVRAGALGIPPWLVNLVVNVQYPLELYSVTYWTLDVRENPQDPNYSPDDLVVATGLVIIPQVPGREICGLPMTLYCHGTIFGRNNVPSHPALLREDLIAAFGFAGQGYITVAPDYVGYGDAEGSADMHPYLDAATEAAASLDLLDAAREVAGIAENQSLELFITGHSQGGHAAMAALAALSYPRNPEEVNRFRNFELKFAAPSSGPYDLSGVQFDFVFGNPGDPLNPDADPGYDGEELTLLVLAGCQTSVCPFETDLNFCVTDNVLKGEYRPLYEGFILDQHPDARLEVESYHTVWNDFFTQTFLDNLGDLRYDCLQPNNVYYWGRNKYNYTPTTLFYCGTDLRVTPENAIKTRDKQRAQIPWYLFWMKWRINAFNSGDFDHFTCALPSLYYARMAFDLNRTFCPYLKRTAPALPRQIAGIDVPLFLFFDAEIDLSRYAGQIVAAELRDGNDQIVRSWGAADLAPKRLTITRGALETGMYGLVFRDETGKSLYAAIMVQDPEIAVSDLYDPISPNPMQRQATLDLSLLEEPVSKISIYTTNGELLLRVPAEPGAKQIQLERSGLPAGNYLVEVRTNRQSYFLPLETIPIPSQGSIVAPNPMREKAWVDLTAISGKVRSIQLFSPEGRLLRNYAGIREGAEWFEIDRGDLPAGLYLLEIRAESGKHTVRIVLQ